MNNENYCYEPFAVFVSCSNTYLASVFKITRKKSKLYWLLHDIKFKTEEEALQVAQNYIDKIIYE